MVWHTDTKVNESDKRGTLLKVSSPANAIKTQVKEELKTFKDLLKAYWQQYCEKSTIHGVRYIYDPTLRGIERLIWTTLVITFVTLTCIAYLMLFERYSDSKLQTVVQNAHYPVFQIPFPAVAFCTYNRINWEKFSEAKGKFLSPSADKATEKVFTDFVTRMDTLRFGQFEHFKDMEEIDLQLIDHIDVTKLAKFMAIKCEDILINGSCMWRGRPFDCCSRFILERTEFGYCVTFNSALSKESLQLQGKSGKNLYPYHNAKAGQNTGLNVRIQMHSKLKSPSSKAENAIAVLIKRNNQLSEASYTIIPNTVTYFMVRPQITDSDDDLKYLDPIMRNCYFEDENNLLNVAANMSGKCRLNNCLNICHEEHVIKYCNCTMGLFFLSPNEKVEQCTPANFSCLAKNNDVFSYDKREEEDAYFRATKPGMTCSCLIPCNSVEYFTSLTTIPLRDEETNASSVDIYEVDVHYQSDVIIQYRTSLEFTCIDLIANFGGIFGLCLGASLVSAVELLYYATFGFGLYLYDNNYFTVLKANLKRVTQKFTIGFMNSFKDASDVGHVVASSPKLKHHHLHKANRW